ncbi:MAG: hypothetical protein HY326_07700 [Chloroflexi bacterium]|nr:hypothetical protein [Chloroflexota bacterium]
MKLNSPDISKNEVISALSAENSQHIIGLSRSAVVSTLPILPYSQDPATYAPIIAADGPTLYLGTASHGIWKSIDDGKTWLQINQGLGSSADITVMALTADRNRLVSAIKKRVGTDQAYFIHLGIYFSANGGTTWRNLGPARDNVKSLKLDINRKTVHVTYMDGQEEEFSWL